IKSDETERERLLGQVKWVSQLPWLLLVLYWLLNISNYRVNCYRLHSFISLAIYEKELSEFTQADQVKIKSLGGFITEDLFATQLGYDLSWPHKKNPDLFTTKKRFLLIHSEPFSEALTPFLPAELCSHVLKYPNERPKLDIESNDSSKIYSSSYGLIQTTQNRAEQARLDVEAFEAFPFIVTQEMLEPLRTLRLSRGMGELFTLKELKLAYKQCALRTHPDKTGSQNTDAFNAVTEAFDNIIELISLSKTNKGDLRKLAYHLAALKRSVKELAVRIDAFTKNIELRESQLNEIDARINEMEARIYKINEPRAEILAELDKEVGLPAITEEDIEGCLKDPDYFNKKYAAMGEDFQEDWASVAPVSIFISTDGSHTSTSAAAAHVEHLTEKRL
ncbi:MAG: hypothetical protein Q8R83_10845, partial [Legionellaceae bacterium]|nr:hypothetical protein [Legionellaceae bacterium]